MNDRNFKNYYVILSCRTGKIGVCKGDDTVKNWCEEAEKIMASRNNIGGEGL